MNNYNTNPEEIEVLNKPFAHPESKFTIVHNDIFDNILPICTASEFKILMVIFRKTRGWQKTEDKISYSQLRDCSGIKSNTTIQNGLKGLEEKGMISIKPDEAGGTTTYFLNVDYVSPANAINVGDYRNCKGGITETVKGGITETVNTKDIPLKKGKKKDSTDEKPVGNAADIPEEKPTKPDPPSKHEAVVAYKEIRGGNRNPNSAQMKAIIETVTDIPLWKLVVDDWFVRGRNPVNILGMLDIYKKGGPPEDQWSKKGKPKAPPIPGKHPENEQSDALLNAFLESTGIARVMLDEDKAVSEINQRWIPGGVTPDDVREAAKELLEKGYSVAGPWSLTNSINAIKSKSAKSAKPDFSAYKVVQ